MEDDAERVIKVTRNKWVVGASVVFDVVDKVSGYAKYGETHILCNLSKALRLHLVFVREGREVGTFTVDSSSIETNHV